jgi:hypothetical protein
VKIFNYNCRNKSLTLVKEAEVIEDAYTSLKRYQLDRSKYIAVSNSELYIGPHLFLFNSFTTAIKDGTKEYENARNKKIADFEFGNLFAGPMPSLDNNYLMYVKVESEDLELEYEEDDSSD